MDDAILHCTRGIGIWDWASNDGARARRRHGLRGRRPDARDARRGRPPPPHLPDLRVRVVNVVDLMRLQDEREHPHGLPDPEFDGLFTTAADDLRVPRLPVADPPADVSPPNHANLHVRGYKEEGTTTTPFDMVMLNDIDRFHLVMDVIDRVPGLASRAGRCARSWSTGGCAAREYTRLQGDDEPGDQGLAWPTGGSGRVLVLNPGSATLKATVPSICPIGRRLLRA